MCNNLKLNHLIDDGTILKERYNFVKQSARELSNIKQIVANQPIK